MIKYNLRTEYLKAGVIYFVLICAIYSPIVFYGKSLSASARYPWFQTIPSETENIYVLPESYPNTFNVDLAHPAAHEEPIDVFIGNQIRNGRFPLWNPFLACGTTIIEQFSTRLLFPYQLLQNICPWQWREFFLLGRLFFAAMGAFIFLKVLGISFYPALCGGIMYGFSGAMTVFLTLTEMSNVGMMLPYALLGSELLNRRPVGLSVAFCSLVTALLILGGQPEVSFYGIIFFISFFFFRIVSNREKKIIFAKKILFFILSIMLSLLISSPFFIPFLVDSEQYYTLHPPGGTMGIESPTPLAISMAIFLPELLRWRSIIFSFTMNAGWDYLGGYIGIAGIFIILASLRIYWWGRKVYLFFLCFSLFILLKNLGFPIINWVGRFPIFDQVWTPRWTGPIWNLSLALCIALGFQALLLTGDKEPSKDDNIIFLKRRLWAWWITMIGGILILSLGILINPALWIILNKSLEYSRQFSSGMMTILRLFLIAIGGTMLFKSVKRLNFSPLFIILSFGIALCIVNFQAQLPRILGFKSFFDVEDKLVLFSMWQGMMESVVLGLTVLLALSTALKQKLINQTKFAFIISGIIMLEMSFHVTLGYDERGRLVRLLLHFIALLGLILYMLFPKNKITDSRAKMFICLFFVGMIAVGRIGNKCIPNRGKDAFKNAQINFNLEKTSRIMGIKGLIFPNTAAAIGVQDIRSVVSLSIKRFQLFQDYCLSVKPQGKYKRLWFTGIMDPDTGKNISEHLQERYPFYALAGVSNYFSPHYENIPHTKLIEDGAIKNYQNLAVIPRVFIVNRWFVAETPDGALDWMLSHPFSLDVEAVVEGGKASSVSNIQTEPFTKVRIKSYQLHSVIIEAETNFPGLLILTDAYHPDWKVAVNGKNEKIFPANLCFRGVFLNPGKHEIKFTYFPKTFYICATVSFIILVVFLILGLKRLGVFFLRKI